ncbi:MAG TPA: RDD family protein [Pyrinomonadaceae bacterium]|nr:RDD family protein [Pyrinomonadaceae bacterium]
MTPSAAHESPATDMNDNTAALPASTLIEFPTPGRAPRPQWRKELSERVREIQQRKAQEAAREAEAEAAAQGTATVATEPDAPPTADAQVAFEPVAPPLGLVPPTPAPEMHPLAVKALKRIARAQQTSAPPVRAGRRGHGAATAAARVVREDYQAAFETAPPTAQPAPQAAEPVSERAPELTTHTEQSAVVASCAQAEQVTTDQTSAPSEQQAQTQQSEPTFETSRTINLVVVPPPAIAQTENVKPETVERTETVERQKARRHIPVVLDEAYLARREAAERPTEAPTTQAFEPAPLLKRAAGGVIDLLVVTFAATPFAAIIELTNGNWSDPRVSGSLGGIVCILMFLYFMVSTALAGRTWGMSLVALRTVDADTGCAPTTGQCVRRALGFMLALALGGLGLIYALFDPKGRALQDHISGTINVRE